MQAILWRLVRSAVTTAIGGWWATKQNDPRWLAGIPIVHTAFKWLRDKYPTNGVINALPF